MSYQQAITAAGAKVLDTLYAGSYQGTWGSIVEFEGKKGLVTGAFGSCSHCDAFQSEFDDWMWHMPREREGKYFDDYGDEITKEQYDQEHQAYQNRLVEFGMSYLKVIQDKWDVENQLKNRPEDEWWDDEMGQLLRWAAERL
jgi:hypothetical protein